jgi:hypothetical protein
VGVVAPPEAVPDLVSRLTDAVDRAREAAVEEARADMGAAAAAEAVGEHVEARPEEGAVTHYFAATHGGYRGWRWAVTLACADADSPVTVSEVVLQPGPEALTAPEWVPWQERVRPGDLGVGDLLPAAADDTRLVPGYLAGEDPEMAEVAREVGLGRSSVLSAEGRDAAARRWTDGPHGPGAEMARAAPARCATCGFLLSLGGSLRGAFGVCANEYSPADGSVVAMGFGCGAHSDVSVEPASPVAVVELVYDDGVELEPVGTGA